MIGRFAVVFGFTVLFAGQSAKAQDVAQQHLEQLAIATSLDRDGLVPWHLKMSFELNDLKGKPEEKGTIEEWWTPKGTRLVVQSPSYNVSFPGDEGKAPDRESYLVKELLDQVVHPIPRYGNFYDLNVEEQEQMFGNTALSCLYVLQKTATATRSNNDLMYCIDPGTNVLRVSSNHHEPYVVRNRIGDFLNTNVAMDDTISYGGRISISGHVDVLGSYTPEVGTAKAPATSLDGEDSSASATSVPSIVIAGKILRKAAPTYPEIAKMEHIEGTVVLGAIISKTGTISTLYVIASPDESLSKSAMDAVKQWQYQPDVLNGQPTEVDTALTVNFRLNRR
jgi:TonB family protein